MQFVKFEALTISDTAQTGHLRITRKMLIAASHEVLRIAAT